MNIVDNKTVFVNPATYTTITNQLGYEPVNLKTNPYIEDTKAIILDNEETLVLVGRHIHE